MTQEPVLIAAAIRATLLAIISFGVGLTEAQVAATMLAVEAILAVVTRARVTPVGR
ncbi:MAG: hypothetical protein AB7G23_03065 [Vicinamibacterales bacterium]